MAYSYDAKILSVIDGDTVKASLRLCPMTTVASPTDLGLHVYVEDGFLCAHENLRLAGINAPEKNTPAGVAAKAWLSEQLPAGTRVQCTTTADRTEKYGRFLAVLTLPRQTASLNDQLVLDGYAFAWDGHGTRPTS